MPLIKAFKGATLLRSRWASGECRFKAIRWVKTTRHGARR
jgi:hypothetical protein